MHGGDGNTRRSREAEGSALVAVLWCCAVLTIVTLSVLHTTQIDLRVAKNYGDAIQAHYLAVAGIEKAKALIYQESRDLQESTTGRGTALLDNSGEFRDIRLGSGVFRVFRQAHAGEDRSGVIFGISDEESRLSANNASAAELAKLPEMASDVAAAIIDWRDEDETPGSGGAEQDYYASLSPPYRVRNAPLESIRELLRVRGVSAEALLGEDQNGNGLLDPEEDDGSTSPPLDNADGALDRGWSSFLTVSSGVRNTNARGKTRVNVSNADEKALAAVDGISTELAKAIVAYRSKNSFDSIADLLDVVPVKEEEQEQRGQPSGESEAGEGNRASSPRNEERREGNDDSRSGNSEPAERTRGTEGSGQKLVSTALLQEIADDITTDSSLELSGVVNVNTARLQVLSCLPGVTEEIAQAIVDYRHQNGAFSNIAGLLSVPGINKNIFKQLSSRVTARSGTFRILAEGLVPSRGARKRLEAVVRLGDYEVTTLYYREYP